MKARNVLIILVAVAMGFAITLVSGLYEQTLLPENPWSGTIETWYGFPFGWRGYSQVARVLSGGAHILREIHSVVFFLFGLL